MTLSLHLGDFIGIIILVPAFLIFYKLAEEYDEKN